MVQSFMKKGSMEIREIKTYFLLTQFIARLMTLSTGEYSSEKSSRPIMYGMSLKPKLLNRSELVLVLPNKYVSASMCSKEMAINFLIWFCRERAVTMT